jgi:predicted negative regulator of RcsB-dependent stress response
MFAAGVLFVKNFFTSIFGDWKVLLLLIVAIVGGLIGWKIYHLEKSLKSANEIIQVEKKNNEVLRGNVNSLVAINQENQQKIEQLVKDKQLALESSKKLSDSIAKTTKSFEELNAKLDTIKTDPTKLTPFLIQAIDGIQQERGK